MSQSHVWQEVASHGIKTTLHVLDRVLYVLMIRSNREQVCQCGVVYVC